MDREELLRKYRNMKPSEFIEEVFGIKLLAYQKILVDSEKKIYLYPWRFR